MCGGVPKEKGKWLGYKNGFEKPMKNRLGFFGLYYAPFLVQNGEHGHWESLFLPLLYHNQWIIPPEVTGKEIPFPLFLFTLVVDSFSQLLSKGEQEWLFSEFRIGSEKNHMSRLQFANDTLIFLEKEIINNFSNAHSMLRNGIGSES